MQYVDTQFGLNTKSQADPTKGPDLLASQLGHAVDATGSLIGTAGQISSTHSLLKGEQTHLYVVFKDITNPAWPGPAGNGFLAAALYINGEPAGVVRLNYYEYYNNAQLRIVNSNGKTNVLKELTATIP